MRRTTLITIALIAGGLSVIGGLAVVALTSSGPSLADTPAEMVATSPAAPSGAARDPYDVYLQLAPAGAPALTREDAQARAYLGCGATFAPGTVDAALAEAYQGICAK